MEVKIGVSDSPRELVFTSAQTAAMTEQQIDALIATSPIVLDLNGDGVRTLAASQGVQFDLKQQGILHIYRDKAGFDHAGEVSKLLAAGGLPRRAVTPAEMRAIEPTLAGHYYGGYYTESDSTGDIHLFTNGLAAAAERLGVRLLFGQQVRSLHSDGHTIGEPAILACWDADRLDLARVGIELEPSRLCTEPARHAQTIDAAVRLAVGERRATS